MTGQRERRRPESVFGVALFTFVPVPRSHELSGMSVFMAIETGIVGHPVMSVLAGRNVAFRTFNRGVPPEQRICALLMHRHGEQRRFERVFVVAPVAILALKLTLMRIGRMAIGALRVGDRLFEIRSLVTIETGCPGVGPKQRELCHIVIEVGSHPHLFPAECRVAVLAGRSERAVMRILVAAGAGGERRILILHKTRAVVSASGMALLAGQVGMQAGQRITGFTVIKTGWRLP